jgi:DNA-binding LytR/AlgR family response regulator
VRFDRLRQAVDRARRRRAQRESLQRAEQLAEEIETLRASGALPGPAEDGFWVPERHGQRRVPIESIDWIEAARDYVLLHTDMRSHLLRITMAALEERLAGTKLLRVHRSAFVRPDRVTEVKKVGRSLALVLTDGAEVQVGPSYDDAVKDALGLD